MNPYSIFNCPFTHEKTLNKIDNPREVTWRRPSEMYLSSAARHSREEKGWKSRVIHHDMSNHHPYSYLQVPKNGLYRDICAKLPEFDI